MAQSKYAGAVTITSEKSAIESFLRKYWAVYVLVLPAVIWRVAYSLFPLLQTFWLSLTNTSLGRQTVFVGLKNYLDLSKDPLLIQSVGFTVIFTVVSTLLQVILGLAIAMLLNQGIKGEKFANFALLLPWAMAPFLAGIVWKLIYTEDGGILNEILRQIGLPPVRWLSDSQTTRMSVIVTSVWKNVSWVALIFLAALKALPRDVLEAAAVDGAGRWQKFRLVTLPMLQSSILLVFMLRSMGEVQTFEQVYGLTGGGPGTATRTIALYSFERFFQQFRYGYGSAINVILLILTAMVGGFFAWRLFRLNKENLS